MDIILQIDGGIGKSVMATAVCKAIKKQYAKSRLVVISAYPDVFLCNPNVDKVLTHNNLPYFYSDHIDGKDVKLFLHNPYLETDFINGEGHLMKVWCEMNGLKYKGELPEIFLTDRERTFYGRNMGSDKPIFLIQTNGGGADQPNKYSWMRDLPISTAQQVVDAFTYDYNVVHIRRDDQLQLKNVTAVQLDFRAIAVLIQISAKRLFLDSFAQHTAAALGKPSVVCWIGNTPQQFGYDMHTNIVANAPTVKPELRHSVYSRYNISGQATEFPYNGDDELFDADRIIEALTTESLPAANDPVAEGVTSAPSEMLVRRKIVREVHRKSMVAQRLMHLLGQTELTNIKRVLDIGSWHLGQSIEFSNVFGDAKIDAFEPVPDSYQLCVNRLKGLEKQKRERIKVHNMALSNAEGEMPFYAVDPGASSVPNVGASSMFKFIDGLNGSPFGQNLVQREIKVRTDTLDNWCAENDVQEVDIMWVDAQGSELLVMQGAENILKNTRVIMTEVGLKPYYEGHTMKADIDAFLKERGFTELEEAFEINVPEYEANTIYIKN